MEEGRIRDRIVAALREAPAPLGPKQIQETTGDDYAAIQQELKRAQADQEVRKVGRGQYTIAAGAAEVPPEIQGTDPRKTDFSPRTAEVGRDTAETRVRVRLGLDGPARYENHTGVGFLDHMLDLFAKHGGFELEVHCEGDLHVDEHHTVEDVGITLGQALGEALGDKAYIARYGQAYVPMDETLARAVVDLSGRFYLHFDAAFARPQVGDLSTEMVRHFWYSFAEHARCNLHLSVLYGENTHHRVEALFKAAARALRMAVRRDPASGRMPSTKGSL